MSVQLAEVRKNVEPKESTVNISEKDALSHELVAAKAEIERLRSEATDDASTGEITEEPQDEASQQVERRVASIRADLEQKHAERVRQVEEQYQKRTDQMKTQLSTKLKEGRESIKQDLQKEHEEAMQRLKDSHAEELKKLQDTHKTEIVQLQSKISASIPSADPMISKESTAEGTATAVKAEAQAPTWPQTESGVKDFIANSPTAKGILRQNVLTKLNQEREAIAAKVREEQDKVSASKLEEMQKKADVAKEQAVIMESKRFSVKISMAENKARQAIAKIEVVEKAAKDTPQRPVVEVWAVAKQTKAPLIKANAASQPAANAVKAPQMISADAARPTPVTAAIQGQNEASQQLNQLSGTPGLQAATGARPPNQMAAKTDAATSDVASADRPAAIVTASIPTGTTSQQTTPSSAHPLPIKPTQQAQQAERAAAAAKVQSAGGAGTDGQRATGPGMQSSSAIPRGGSGIARGTRGRGGIPTPHGQQGGASTQAINHPGGVSQRGMSSLPRGGGGGRGRGGGGHGRGQATIQTGNTQPGQGMASPGTGRGINPAAKQFVPGTAKRTREEAGDVGEVANAGKRARGGGNIG